MLVLERKGNEVYCNGQKLTIVAQATKGPNKEVIKIKDLEGSNGAKWLSLTKLKEGLNEIEPQAKEVTGTGSYTLTNEEKAEIAKLQARIDEIKTQAKARYVAKPTLKADISSMTEEEKLAEIEKIKRYYGL